MSLKHGPKPKCLNPVKETLSSLEVWKSQIVYGLRLNPDFKPYLEKGYVWGKKTRTRPYRNLKDEIVHHEATTNPAAEERDEIVKSKKEKAEEVELMLEQIANYAECILREDITEECASLDDVWQTVKMFYNLQSSGALLNQCWNIQKLPDESPQALYSRLKQTYYENLITKNTLIHKDGVLPYDEEMSPTLSNTIVLHWLEILHPKLRNLVTQKFAIDLRKVTYATLFPEISRSIDCLLEELDDDASCRRISYGRSNRSYDNPGTRDFKSYPVASNSPYQKRCCDYCKALGRKAFNTHNQQDCLFIKNQANPTHQRKVRSIESEEVSKDEDDLRAQYEDFYKEYEPFQSNRNQRVVDHVVSRINVDSSPVLKLHHGDKPADITIDSGATCDVVKLAVAEKLKCKLRPTNKTCSQADGHSNLDVVAETDVTFHRGKKTYYMSALVATDCESDFLGGIPFMSRNDVAVRPATCELIIDGVEFISYGPAQKSNKNKCKQLKSYSIQASCKSVILPGEELSLEVPPVLQSDTSVAVEPRFDSHFNRSHNESSVWPPPQVVSVHNKSISLKNNSEEPVMVKKHEQICIVHDFVDPDDIKPSTAIPTPSKPESKLPSTTEDYTKPLKLDPDNLLSKEQVEAFREVLTEYNEVFSPQVSRYNGKSGPCYVEVNMGSTLPPQHKGRTPGFYGRGKLNELQEALDDLTDRGVLGRPQELGVSVENVCTSFLVKKPNNPDKKRLVSDFSSIAPFCRPTPTLLPKVDSVLQTISAWKYIITTDLIEAYYALEMKKSSMRYCGVVTPYKGLRVYRVGVMGLPGVEVALEELTCLVLGDLVQRGIVAKVADDIYIGGNTPEELMENFKTVLHRFKENNLKLSARKTVIAPKEVNILGWLWSSGRIRASPHRLAALAECTPPATVSAMRSFIGAFRYISRVLKGYATLLAPLEKAISGAESGKQTIEWSESLSTAFKSAQEALKDSKTLTMPRPEDTLWIVTDASVLPGAVGATLYTVRDGDPKLAEHFNAKLPEFQQRWLPCEVEGIAIGTALHHFAPFIIQSSEKPQVLTDSKPCVQAIQKMYKGQFSTSARLSTFLSAVSRYQAQVRHLSGVANLPSDFASRHPVPCQSATCQICGFIKEYADSVVQSLSVTDVLQGKARIPYKNRKAWGEVQQNCPDLKKVLSFRKSGTAPSKKSKNMRYIRRYLTAGVMLAADGLLVYRKAEPLSPLKDHIVVPQQVLHGVLSALHITLGHPTAYQLARVFSKEFFALSLSDAVSEVTSQCHLCESIKKVPKALIEQSSSEPPHCVGVSLAADVMKRSRHNILVLRETTSSYTLAELIPDEKTETVANALLRMCCILRPSAAKELLIRVDPAPSCRSLFLNLDSVLEAKNIHLEIGRELSKNKNPVAESAIGELSREILVLIPDNKEITPTTLSLAVANLNSRIRAPGLSSQEIWTQRDQVSGEQLPVIDEELISSQHRRRRQNHASSEASKAGGRPKHPFPKIAVGSLVYLWADRDKESPRARYLVISIHGEWCKLRRFTKTLFGGRTYDAKLEECYTVPVENISSYRKSSSESEYSSDSEDEFEDTSVPIPIPQVPQQPPRAIEDQLVPVEAQAVGGNQDVVPPPVLVQPPALPKRARRKVNNHDIGNEEQEPTPRPKRQVKAPDRYRDYVMGESE